MDKQDSSLDSDRTFEAEASQFSGELLDEPPRGEYHLGRFAGHRAAFKLRRRIVFVLLAAVAMAFFAYHHYVEYLRYQDAHPLAEVEGLIRDDAPREMSWAQGEIRIALRSAAPAANRLRLPDRVILLAEGCDFAQIYAKVENGRTVELRVVRGKVVQQENFREGEETSAGSSESSEASNPGEG